MRLSLGILPVEKRFSSGTASGFNLSWDGLDSTTCGYAVEWCILGNAVPCTLRWMKVPAGSNTLFLPASKFIFFCRHCMCGLKVLLTLAFNFFVCLQEISKQAVGTHLVFMDAQKKDTGYWRHRLDIHKSSVSVKVTVCLCIFAYVRTISCGSGFQC